MRHLLEALVTQKCDDVAQHCSLPTGQFVKDLPSNIMSAYDRSCAQTRCRIVQFNSRRSLTREMIATSTPEPYSGVWIGPAAAHPMRDSVEGALGDGIGKTCTFIAREHQLHTREEDVVHTS